MIGRCIIRLIVSLPDLLPQPLTNCVPQDQIATALARSTDVREAEEGEGLRFAKPPRLAVARRETPELDDPGLLRMQFQSELLQSLSKLVQKPLSIGAMLEAHHGVVSITHDDDLADIVLPPPVLDPQVVDVVQINVRQDR